MKKYIAGVTLIGAGVLLFLFLDAERKKLETLIDNAFDDEEENEH